MLYMGRRIKPDRRKREVRRCLKCQHFEPAHLAAACKGEDTCGTCSSKEHKTQACYVPEGPERFCVNCNEHGHASWERECPMFIRLNRCLQSRDPLEKYKYFPIPGDPSTWELLVEEDTFNDFQGSWERPCPPPEFTHTSLFRHDVLAGMHPSRAANLGTSFEEALRAIREEVRRDREHRPRDAPPHCSTEPSQGLRG